MILEPKMSHLYHPRLIDEGKRNGRNEGDANGNLSQYQFLDQYRHPGFKHKASPLRSRLITGSKRMKNRRL
jgi:hypothetical protein